MRTLNHSKTNGCWKILFSLALLLLPWSFGIAQQQPLDHPEAQVWSLKLSGGIGPASSDYVIRTLQLAAEAKIHLLIIELDTPGGLDKSMREMIKQVIASPLPVATYVYPSGSRAASAGTYLLYASHIAAMAPATNLGAASPVQIGAPAMPGAPQPVPSPNSQKPNNPKDGDGADKAVIEDSASTMRRKVMNDSVAYIQGLAQLHERNVEWAEKAVRSAESISAKEALSLGVIDIVANDVTDLLGQLHGRSVNVQHRDYLLQTEGLTVRRIEPDWRNQFLAMITNPNVAYILMLIGVYGLLLEFYNPGVGLPGVVGGISLLIALYAFQLLPVSYVGLALIVLGIALMSMEALSPSFGIFGFGGTVAFAVGSVMLMDSELPGYQIATPVIAAFTVFSLLISIGVLAMALKARKQRVVSGDAILVGQQVVAIESFDGQGRVSIQGEIWNASSGAPVSEGEELVVRAVDGLVLLVNKRGEPS